MVAWRSRKHAGRGDDPAAPMDPPTVHSASVAPESFAVSTDVSPPEVSEVADVIGATAVPQIVVGSPSPSVEPSAIGAAYRSFPFRPDVVIDGWSTEAITVRGVSQRGHLHRYNGAPRQDDFAVHHLPDGRVIVLVADGVSQAPQSHIGSSTAIRTAAEWLASHLGDDIADTDWMALLKNAAWALNERAQTLLGLDEADPVRAEELLATTLVGAVIEPAGAEALRASLVGVGDSVAWLLSGGEFVEILAGKKVPASGIASSAVVGLPRVPTEVKPVVVDIEAGDVLLMASDGIGDPLGSGHGGVGNLFREMLTGRSVPSLIEFAHAVDFSREAFDDDRTLVAVWPRKQVPVPSETARHSRAFSPPDGLRGL
jgi:serine/threonine protein phosphatase PrpC